MDIFSSFCGAPSWLILVFTAYHVFNLPNAVDSIGGGFSSCKDNGTICQSICETSLSLGNPIATINPMDRKAKCDDNGICHCYVEQAPGTSDRIRPPRRGEESQCKCMEPSPESIESPSVYEDKQKQPGVRYCVCFSALRKGKKSANGVDGKADEEPIVED